MKEEIIGGLRNALERGETIEKAMQSFVNAGYSPNEVREAAIAINPSASGLLYGQPAPSAQPTTPLSPQSSQSSAAPSASTVKKASEPQSAAQPQSLPSQSKTALPTTIAKTPQPKGRKVAIILAIILIILVLVLGITLWYSKDIIAWFST
jgi:hypothetical protein